MTETLETLIFLAPIAIGIIGGIIWDIRTDKTGYYNKKYNNFKNF